MNTLFSQFYYDMKAIELNDEQIQIVNSLLEEAGESHENH